MATVDKHDISDDRTSDENSFQKGNKLDKCITLIFTHLRAAEYSEEHISFEAVERDGPRPWPARTPNIRSRFLRYTDHRSSSKAKLKGLSNKSRVKIMRFLDRQTVTVSRCGSSNYGRL
jgi:hypothetical protein